MIWWICEAGLLDWHVKFIAESLSKPWYPLKSFFTAICKFFECGKKKKKVKESKTVNSRSNKKNKYNYYEDEDEDEDDNIIISNKNESDEELEYDL